jgi:hypothetical protein
VGDRRRRDSTLIGNTATNNTGLGLLLTPGSGYGNNVLNRNNGSGIISFPQVAGGIEMGANICNGHTTCP